MATGIYTHQRVAQKRKRIRDLTIHPSLRISCTYGTDTPTPMTFPIVAMTVIVPFMNPRSCEGEASEQYPGEAFCTKPT